MRYPSPAPFDRSGLTGMKSMHVDLADSEVARTLAGAQNENLKLVERRLGVRVGQRGTELHLSGPDAAVATAVKLLEGLASALKSGRSVYREDVEQALKAMGQGDETLRALSLSPILTQRSGRHVTPRSLAQQKYVELIRTNDVVFGLGPAGTGKTYLAMAMAVQALSERKVKRIVLARPAVEAGEKLGFLPGDLAEKVNPYLRPLYDALHDMMEPERVAALLEQGVIEVAPLAFMRGRTLNDCFAILDEAQNTTVEQMKMFLTRIGYHSRAVVTGDVTQIDLPTGKQSGLVHARRILQGVEGVAFAQFTDVDVVRHPVVAEVIKAYAREELSQADAVSEPRPSRPSPPPSPKPEP
jgi:phosphate starvation-inducible PhoH-like protein